MMRESGLEGPVRADNKTTPSDYARPYCERAWESTTAEREGRSVTRRLVLRFEVLRSEVSPKESPAFIREFVNSAIWLVQQTNLQELPASLTRVLPVVIDVRRDYLWTRQNIVILEEYHDLIIKWREPRDPLYHLSSCWSVHVTKVSRNSHQSTYIHSLMITTNVVRTKYPAIRWNFHGSTSRTRRSQMGPLENQADPALGTPVRAGFLSKQKAMLSNDSRGLENSARPVESTENHYSCPRCGEPVESVSATAPARHELNCGCEATLSTRAAVEVPETQLITDGGEAPECSIEHCDDDAVRTVDHEQGCVTMTRHYCEVHARPLTDGGVTYSPVEQLAAKISGKLDLDARALEALGVVEITATKAALQDAKNRLREDGYVAEIDESATPTRLLVYPPAGYDVQDGGRA